MDSSDTKSFRVRVGGKPASFSSVIVTEYQSSGLNQTMSLSHFGMGS